MSASLRKAGINEGEDNPPGMVFTDAQDALIVGHFEKKAYETL